MVTANLFSREYTRIYANFDQQGSYRLIFAHVLSTQPAKRLG